MKNEFKKNNFPDEIKKIFKKLSKNSISLIYKTSFLIVSIQLGFLVIVLYDNRFGIGEKIGIRKNNRWETTSYLLSKSIPSKHLKDYGSYLKELIYKLL